MCVCEKPFSVLSSLENSNKVLQEKDEAIHRLEKDVDESGHKKELLEKDLTEARETVSKQQEIIGKYESSILAARKLLSEAFPDVSSSLALNEYVGLICEAVTGERKTHTEKVKELEEVIQKKEQSQRMI